jgi:hypothetical protein
MQSRHIRRAPTLAWAQVGCLAVVLAAGAMACSQPQERGSDEASPPPPPKTAPQKKQVVQSAVSWPARATLDEPTRQALSPKSLAAVDRSPVPVLVVARPALLAASTVMSKAAWYALSTRDVGITVSLSASNVAHRYPRTPLVRGPRKVRGQDAFVTQNEGIWSAAWVESGAAYSLELECATPSDARCADPSYLMGLADDLRYVGGAGAEQAERTP